MSGTSNMNWASGFDKHDYFHGTPAKIPLSTFNPRLDPESDNPFFPKDPTEVLESGDYSHVPMIISLTDQEGCWFTASLFNKKFQHVLDRTKGIELDIIEGLLGMYEFPREVVEK